MKLDFCEVFDDYTSRCRKIPKEEYLSNGKYIVIDQGKNSIAGYTNVDDGLFEDVPAIVFGDHTRIIKYVDEPFFLGADGVKLLKSKIKDANYKYLYYALRNARIPDTGYNRHFKWLKEISLEYKDAESQKNIVKILDTVTNIIELCKAELSELDNLIKARFVEMFGSIYNNEYGYNIKTLQDVCEQIKDGTHQTPMYTEDKGKGFKFLSSKDVVSGKIDWSRVKYISAELHEELYSRIKPKRGDLLLAKNGTTGVAAIVETDEVFDIYVSLAILRPVDINSVYLWGAVNSMESKRQFDESLKGIGVPNLHLGEIKKTKIVVPPIQIQEAFEQFVLQIDKSKVEVKKALDEAQLLFDSLMQKYFG
jgi:restriction modification system DNA specificity domain protein